MTHSSFKHVFNIDLVRTLAERIASVYPDFNTQGFVREVSIDIDTLEMKARASLIAKHLASHLPSEYTQAVKILLSTLGPELPDEKGVFGLKPEVWMMWPLNIYIQEQGLDDLDTSMMAIKELTKRFSCEFAIRPFILKYPDETFVYLHDWVRDCSPHVRRLVSEGTRPFLPWGIKLDLIDKNPTLTLPLLRQLRDDFSEYVRTSVCNHLNDLTRNNASLVLEELRQWQQKCWKNESKMSKKSLRNLIKKGDSGAMGYFGFHKPNIDLINVVIHPQKITIGEEIMFQCVIENLHTKTQTLQIDYIVDYVKVRGKISPKVFKLKTVELDTEPVTIIKKHSFKDNSIRTHYPGVHIISLQINGIKFRLGNVELVS